MLTKSDEGMFGTTAGVLCVIAPLIGGIISAVATKEQMKGFGELNKPPLSPPDWLFPIAWTILYLMMGIALLLLVRSGHRYRVPAIVLFLVQLALNYIWSPVFFNMGEYIVALVILVAMLVLTIVLTLVAWRINRYAALMLIPYILWMGFATYLNVGVAVLNS